MREAVLEDVETYITQRQNTAAQYIAMLTIMDLCEEVEQHPGVQLLKPWWEREGINLAGLKL